MADIDAAANDDDVADLYAGLDDQVAAALATAGESGESNAKDSYSTTDGEEEGPEADADANAAVDLGDDVAGYSSSDESEDDLRIVLNEDGGGAAPPPPPPGHDVAGLEEGEEAEDMGSRAKSSVANGRSLRMFSGLRHKGFLNNALAPITGQGDQEPHHAYQKEFYFFLPRNRTIFDMNIEAFQQKPWRQHGVDITDYFNFGLDEEGWINYCLSMDQFKQRARLLANELSGLNQELQYNIESVKVTPNGVKSSRLEEKNDLAWPQGRAIRVESGACERLPSADTWRPRQQDSDVVIQINTVASSSNPSTSDDSSTMKHNCTTNKGISIGNHDGKYLNDTSFIVGSAVDKEAHHEGTSEHNGSKLDTRDSAGARDQSCTPAYSETLSETSTEDCYFKRAHRHVDTKTSYTDTKLQEEPLKSDCCRHSNKSDQESGKHDNHTCIPASADEQDCNRTKIQQSEESPFSGDDISSNFLPKHQNDRIVLKSGYAASNRQDRQSSAIRRHSIVEKQEKTSVSYTSRSAGKCKQKRYGRTFHTNDDRAAVHKQKCERKKHSFLKRVDSRNDECCLNDDSLNRCRQPSWHDISDDEDAMECFSSAKDQRYCHVHEDRYYPVLKAELSDDINEPTYRESYYLRKSRRVGHDCCGDDEFLHYSDYSNDLRDPKVRGKCGNKRRFAESKDEHLRDFDHLELHQQANDGHKDSERCWSDAGQQPVLLSSSNRHVDDRRIPNAMVMQYYNDGYYHKNKPLDSSFPVDIIKKSSLYTRAVSKTSQCIIPDKRMLHADQNSVNHKKLPGLSFEKGRRLHTSPKMYIPSRENIAREAAHNFDINVISNIFDEKRHELIDLQCKEADGMQLNGRKKKVKRQGNRVRDEDKGDSKEHPPIDKDPNNFRHYEVQRKVQKLERSYHYSSNQVLEKSSYQKQQNDVNIYAKDDEIEEGEVIGEQNHQDTVYKSKSGNPRKVVLKSVIGGGSSGHLGAKDVMSKGDASRNGAPKECNNKHILEVMEKMQKRKERFKEPIAQKKEEDGSTNESLAVSASMDDVKNQRPARKRRWGSG